MTGMRDPELRAEGIVVRYPGTEAGAPPALSLGSLTVAPGRSLALVGESGSGKTTAMRALLGLVPVQAGSITWEGAPIGTLRGDASRAFRRAVQPIPQDADGALDPRQTVGAAIAEGWRSGGSRKVAGASDAGSVVRALLAEVGLPEDAAERHPHRLSGGQRQRAVLARALAVRPRILLLDEPTSGLDATVQLRILELIERLRDEHGLGLLLISHHLGVVARLCPETLVLYRGEVVEAGPTAALLAAPRHPYTAALRRSVPEIGVAFRAPLLPTAAGGAIDPRTGCRWAPRCAHALPEVCAAEQTLEQVPGPGERSVRCARSAELGALDPLA